MSEVQATYQCSLSAQDLRIGNWVYDGERTQFPMQVVAIGKDWAHLDFPGNEGGVWEADIKDLRAIELTEELFKKNGFSVKKSLGIIDSYWLQREKAQIQAYESYYGWMVHINDERYITVFSKRIKYLHQLQNAYYMATGEEMEVQP